MIDDSMADTWHVMKTQGRVVHLDVLDISEKETKK